MSDTIDYGNLMHAAMRRLIQSVLTQVHNNGLPGTHHFFITFDTTADGVELADWLRERYPEEITIVIQNWYDNLLVDDDGFNITLNFGDNPEPMRVPYDAITTFVDPSVEFGLQFKGHEEEGDDPDPEPTPSQVPDPQDHYDAEVVSLDSFRK